MPKTLLLADDSVVIQKLVGLSFANEDVKLLTTDNGDDAISMARERRPDIVLADVVMPGRSGYEVCQAIKNDPELAHIPVILLTGTFEAFDEARARAAGSDGHITKPFEAQALVERVNTMLREAAAAPAAAPVAEADFEIFDTDGADVSLGQDVTRAAPPHVARPLDRPTALDPLGGDDSFDFGDPIPVAPGGDDDDPLDQSFEFGDEGTGSDPGRPAMSALSDLAEDDLLATPSPRVQAAPTRRPADARDPMRALDATPPLADPLPRATPPPLPTHADPAHSRPPDLPTAQMIDDFSSDDLSSPGNPDDPSLTTIIMSEGDQSSDGVSFGELVPPVRSLDLDVDHDRDDDVLEMDGGATMLADDIFGEPVVGEDSDSGFDFGGAAMPSSRDSHRSTESAASPFSIGSGDARRGAPPEVASRYDVSTSELVEPFDAEPSDANGLGSPDDDLLDTPHAEDEEEIAMSDGLLGEPFDLREEHARSTPPPTAAPAPVRSSGPDISPVMRDRIHDTLERVAWEAFADLPDALIKALIERVEAIAWEVIPQMAEALISEEIRRMKGEDQ